MTYGEFMGARQLLMEERVGSRVRAAKRGEDAQLERSLGHLAGHR